jgi:hypothetical protein
MLKRPRRRYAGDRRGNEIRRSVWEWQYGTASRYSRVNRKRVLDVLIKRRLPDGYGPFDDGLSAIVR